jgi:3D (Asp-Asp-Asp) domain-containing protein
MLMPSETNISTPLQIVARRVMVAASVIFAIGLAGVVTAKVNTDRQDRPVIRFVNSADPRAMLTSPLVEVEERLDDAQLASLQIHAEETLVLPPAPAFRILRMEVTAYCACTKCCGPNAQGITASGKLVSYNDGKFVAADTRLLPFGTKLQVPGYAGGETIEVIDRGGAIKGNKLDLYFETHQAALEWGRQWVDVVVFE